jgi:hypothetical protein
MAPIVFTNGGYGTPDTITNPYVTDANVQFINPIVLDPNDMDLFVHGICQRTLPVEECVSGRRFIMGACIENDRSYLRHCGFKESAAYRCL